MSRFTELPPPTENCRSCGAEIRWMELKGKRHPVDAVQVKNGNLQMLQDGTLVVVRPDPNLTRYVSHFSTCPNAPAWRRS